MTISRLELTNFTVFEKASFAFCPGINVLIGENGTGKSHVLKAMYAALRRPQTELAELLRADGSLKFERVFRPQGDDTRRLVRRGSKGGSFVRLSNELGQGFELQIHRSPGKYSMHDGLLAQHGLFLPPREVLAMYRGFIAAYEGRELDFDATYYDLCKALSAAPLRGERAEKAQAMLAPLEQILGGKVVLEGDRFLVKQADGDTEAHLLAEGLRKIASIAYLVANGSLTRDSVLFWDEPEAGLNPALVTKVVDFIRTLAASGVQVFLASHDYLLVHRLSQAAEYGVEPAVPVRFFSLYRPKPGAPVNVEHGDTLVDIEHNAILDEFARHYDREQMLSAAAMRGEASASVHVEPVRASAKTTSARAESRAKKQPAKLTARKAPASRTKAKTSARKVAKKATGRKTAKKATGRKIAKKATRG